MSRAHRIVTASTLASLAVALGLANAGPANKPTRPRSYADRAELLTKLSEKLGCKAQEASARGWCVAVEGYPTGMSDDFTGSQVLVGLTMRVDLGGGDVAFTEEPILSALAVRRQGKQALGAFTDVQSAGPSERKQLIDIAARLNGIFSGDPGVPTLPENVDKGLLQWANQAGWQMYREKTGWQFAGSMGELRKVGPYWVLVGAPRNKTGILLSVYSGYEREPLDAGTPATDGGR